VYCGWLGDDREWRRCSYCWLTTPRPPNPSHHTTTPPPSPTTAAPLAPQFLIESVDSDSGQALGLGVSEGDVIVEVAGTVVGQGTGMTQAAVVRFIQHLPRPFQVGRWVGGSVGRWVGGSVGRWVGGSVSR
jgi:hypothetical protein